MDASLIVFKQCHNVMPIYRYLDPDEIQQLQPVFMTSEDGTTAPTSKKNDTVRRNELLTYLRPDILRLFEDPVAGYLLLQRLLVDKSASRVIFEMIRVWRPVELFPLLIRVIMATSSSGDENGFHGLFENPTGHLFLKHIIDLEKSTAALTANAHRAASAPSEVSINESNSLVKGLVRYVPEGADDHDDVLPLDQWWNYNRGALILAEICTVDWVRTPLRQKLKASKSSIESLASNGSKGCVALLAQLA